MQEHGKGILGLLTAVGGAIVAHWPMVEAGIRDASGLTATVAAIYTALYFRRQWKKS